MPPPLSRACWALEPGSEWLHLSGLRLLADGTQQPLAASSIYIAAAYADLADHAEHPATPIFILIERHRGVRIKEIWQDVTAVPLTSGHARALHATAGSAGLACAPPLSRRRRPAGGSHLQHPSG
ncbi:MAG: UTRA domain-containing protein [Acetobacteraceae bacterium]